MSHGWEIDGGAYARAVLDAVSDAVFVHDAASGTILDVNQRACTMYGYAKEEMLALDPEQLAAGVAPYTARDALEWLARARSTGPQVFEWLARRRDGECFWTEVAVRFGNLQDTECFFVTVRDVSERKRSEDSLRKTNRALRALSGATHALIQASDEQALLNAICRVVIEAGGYRMAWAGYADPGPEHRVRPVAIDGHEAGYLSSVEISWDDSPRGRGPTGTAIRTGKPVVARDFEASPAVAPWRESARERGYRSSIALPLMEQGRAFGALNIYASEPDAFDREETELLGELAGQLSLGICAIRARKERERSQRALEQFRFMVEQGGEEIYLCRPDGSFEYANEAAAQSLGYTVAELKDLGVSGLDPDFGPRFGRHFAELKAGDLPAFETLHLAKDGRKIPKEMKAVYLKIGEEEYVCGFARDMRARKQSEEALVASARALSESRGQLDAVLGNVPVVLFALDAAGRFTLSEGRGLEVLGLKPGEVVGRNVHEVYAAHPDILADLDRALAGATVKTTASLGERGPFFETFYRPILEEGRVVGVTGVAIDVTERALARAERRTLEAQLLQAQKMESVGRLAGGIAHDFNNILSAIIGYQQLASLGLPPEGRLKELLSGIGEAADRAAALTRQLLALSSQQVLAMQVVDVNGVVERISRLLERVIGEDVSLDLRLGAGRLLTRADPTQLEQVLMNLAVNARDAMPRGGRLVIETSRAPNGEIALSVSDTGEGMSPEVQARMFEPFFTTKDRAKGTGLGLATVYGIVKQHGGSITVRSQTGVGTTFEIRLPGSESEETKPVGARPPRRPGGSETVLLVEDEPQLRTILERVLSSLGYRVLSAANGAEGLKLAETASAPIDVVLTDVVMSGMTGPEVADAIIARYPKAKVLFMTGYSYDILEGSRPGGRPAQLIEKPLRPDDLAQKLREVLDGP